MKKENLEKTAKVGYSLAQSCLSLGKIATIAVTGLFMIGLGGAIICDVCKNSLRKKDK